jgi:hypothetical protein
LARFEDRARIFVVLCAIGLSEAACKKTRAPATADAGSVAVSAPSAQGDATRTGVAGASSAAASPGAASPTTPSTGAPRFPGRPSLAQKLQEEAAARPAGALRAEAVLDALGAAGIPITKRQQYLAMVVGAAYCLGGNSPAGTPVSVCEYASEEAAKKGRELSLSRFRVVPKEIWIRRSTTLTVATQPGAAAAEERARITKVFDGL